MSQTSETKAPQESLEKEERIFEIEMVVIQKSLAP